MPSPPSPGPPSPRQVADDGTQSGARSTAGASYDLAAPALVPSWSSEDSRRVAVAAGAIPLQVHGADAGMAMTSASPALPLPTAAGAGPTADQAGDPGAARRMPCTHAGPAVPGMDASDGEDAAGEEHEDGGAGVAAAAADMDELDKRRAAGKRKRTRARTAFEQLQTQVASLEAQVANYTAQHSVLQSTGLPQLQAAMPHFLEQHNKGMAAIAQLTTLIQQALQQQAGAMLPAFNETLMQEEQQLSNLRVEAAQKGCGAVISRGVCLSAMGKTDLEALLGVLPLSLCMQHFIDTHAQAMDSGLLALCQQLKTSWTDEEKRMEQALDGSMVQYQQEKFASVQASLRSRIKASGSTFILQPATPQDGAGVPAPGPPADAAAAPGRSSAHEPASPFNQYVVTRELFRIRELWSLKARLPDSAFSHFVMASQAICNAFETMLHTSTPSGGVGVMSAAPSQPGDGTVHALQSGSGGAATAVPAGPDKSTQDGMDVQDGVLKPGDAAS